MPTHRMRGMREAALVVDEVKMCRGFLRREVRTQAKIRRYRVWVDDLAGVHLPFRVPDVLNSRKASQISAPYIFGRNSALDCPSPCSPDSDPPILDDERGRVVHEGAVIRDAFGGQQVESDPRMNAALAEMPVKSAFIAMFVVKLAQLAQIRTDFVRRNG